MRSRHLSRLIALAVALALMTAWAPLRPATAAGGGVIAYGQTVSGTITDRTYFELWQFEGRQGDRVQITMQGDGQLDPYLGLLELSTEQVLAEDDDSGGNGNALIELTLRSSGSFVIVATRYNFDIGTSRGTYSLSLVGGSGPTNVANPITTGQSPASEPVELEPGIFYMGELTLDEAVSGTITNDAYAQIYSVQVQAGTELYMVMGADESTLDSYLFFADADFNLLAEDDDTAGELGAGPLDAFINLTVPATGQYMVVATRAGVNMGNTTGAYLLLVGVPQQETPVEEPADDNLPAGVAHIGAIGLDSSVQGTLTADTFVHLYDYEGQAGQQITITMSGSGGLDSYLGLIDPAGTILAEDDDSGGNLTALITYTLPESGTYLIVVTRSGMEHGNTVGPYTLSVTAGQPVAEAPAGGLSSFGGLPGRAIASESGTFYLRGNGASNNPEKSPPIEAFLGLDRQLPGSRHPLAGLIGRGWRP